MKTLKQGILLKNLAWKAARSQMRMPVDRLRFVDLELLVAAAFNGARQERVETQRQCWIRHLIHLISDMEMASEY